MTLTLQSEIRDVHGIAPDDMAKIRAFVQGAVYCWIKNRRGEPFAVRDLVGGVNAEWEGTPLFTLYDKHVRLGKTSDEAAEAAGKDLGWIVKSVLDTDARTFEPSKPDIVKAYRWIENPVAVPATATMV